MCQGLASRNTNYSYPFDYLLQTDDDFNSEGNFFVLDNIGVNQPLPCLQPIQYLSCIFTSPPCDVRSDLPLRICPESCLAFDTLMGSSTCVGFNDALVNLVALDTFITLRDIYLQFNCSNTSTYSFSGENGFDNDSCTNIFSADVQGIYTGSTVQ